MAQLSHIQRVTIILRHELYHVYLTYNLLAAIQSLIYRL